MTKQERDEKIRNFQKWCIFQNICVYLRTKSKYMELSEFTQISNYAYLSNKVFEYDTAPLKFKYRVMLKYHTHQPNWDGVNYTIYSFLIQIEDESIPEENRTDPLLKEILHSFLIQKKEYKGDFCPETANNFMLKVIDKKPFIVRRVLPRVKKLIEIEY